VNLVIVSGFLGSGKTTVLLAMARLFAAQGKRLAIIENEVGTVGVDDARLKAEGLEVREIYSGCICCSLRTDLVTALLEIERDYSPDVVMLEPSGVAGPKQVLGALVGYGGEIDRKIMLSIVDAGRFEKIEDLSIPLVTDGIEVADLVVVNKSDLVSEERLEAISHRILGYRKDAEVITVAAATGVGMKELFDSVTSADCVRKTMVESTDQKTGPKPSVHSWQGNMSVSDGMESLAKSLAELVDHVVKDLEQAGCTLIGHVKAIATSGGGGYLVVGKTDFDQPAQVKGRLPKSAESAKLTLNVIVYGVETKVIEDVVKNRLQSIGLA
jgi:G3E family GTPase